MGVTDDDIDRFVEQLLARDRRGAIGTASALLDTGMSVGQVLTRLMPPALAEIGHRWHRDEVSVADEHGASAVAETVVSTLTAASHPRTSGRSVVVVCAEGEWHVLASRVVAEVLRDAGHDVTFLGGSMPASHLARFVDRVPTDAVAISCSTVLALEGALAMVHVLHDLGLPVFGGGRGFGIDGSRARTLGVDVWAPNGLLAADLLGDPLPVRLATPDDDSGAAMEVALHADEVVDRAMIDLLSRFPPMAAYSPYQLARTREDLSYLVQFAQGAILTRDQGLFEEFTWWLDTLLAARGLPAETLLVSLGALTDAAAPVPSLAGVLEPHLVRMTTERT